MNIMLSPDENMIVGTVLSSPTADAKALAPQFWTPTPPPEPPPPPVEGEEPVAQAEPVPPNPPPTEPLSLDLSDEDAGLLIMDLSLSTVAGSRMLASKLQEALTAAQNPVSNAAMAPATPGTGTTQTVAPDPDLQSA